MRHTHTLAPIVQARGMRRKQKNVNTDRAIGRRLSPRAVTVRYAAMYTVAQKFYVPFHEI